MDNFDEWKYTRRNAANGVPSLFALWERKIWMTPPPSVSGTTIFISGWKIPATLAADGDENPIPLRWFDRALVEHVRFRILKDLQEDQGGVAWQDYQAQLARVQSFGSRRRGGENTQVHFRHV
jgi:hypothetical protein